MNTRKRSLISLFSICLFTPVLTQAGSYEDALKAANASIDQAKAANYEWRDSRKLLKKADELHKEGKTDNAIALINKAKQQGELAVLQAQQQKTVNGPR